MKRLLTEADGGRFFRYVGEGEWRGRVGQLEAFPLHDPGSALEGEGVIWFGPEDDRDGWEYAGPDDLEELP